ncbi:MAG: TlpA family protein disulfide reductase, partial [Blastocatellia bacterium]|nr:TlpA family protein disulfide reductase [Blastocatellia bacterium]
DDSVDTVKDFLKKQEMLYPVVYGGDYLDQFGQVSALPTMILIDKTGKVIKKHVGMAPPDALEKAIEAQL